MTTALRRRIALRWAYRHSQAVIAVSEATRRDLEEKLGKGAGVIHTIPNGIPTRPGTADGPRAELGLEDEIVILAVGNLSERKGHIFLLRALALLEQEGLDVPWRIVIAGRGEQKEAPYLQLWLPNLGRRWERRRWGDGRDGDGEMGDGKMGDGEMGRWEMTS